MSCKVRRKKYKNHKKTIGNFKKSIVKQIKNITHKSQISEENLDRLKIAVFNTENKLLT